MKDDDGTVLCDLCIYVDKSNEPAVADMKTVYGPWANVCELHAQTHGVGKRNRVAE